MKEADEVLQKLSQKPGWLGFTAWWAAGVAEVGDGVVSLVLLRAREWGGRWANRSAFNAWCTRWRATGLFGGLGTMTYSYY